MWHHNCQTYRPSVTGVEAGLPETGACAVNETPCGDIISTFGELVMLESGISPEDMKIKFYECLDRDHRRGSDKETIPWVVAALG